MVEQAVTADDTCLSSLMDQPLEVRVVDQHDDEPSHPRCPRARAQPASLPWLSLHGAADVLVEVWTIFDMHSMWCRMLIFRPPGCTC